MAKVSIEKQEIKIKDELGQIDKIVINVRTEGDKEKYSISAFDSKGNEFVYYTYRKRSIRELKSLVTAWAEIKELFRELDRKTIEIAVNK